MPGRSRARGGGGGGGEEKKSEKEEKKARNEKVGVQLEVLMAELAGHSRLLFDFAFKSFEQVGPGVVYWQSDNLEEALEFKAQPLEYRAQKRVEAMEYAPAIQFVEKYDPYAQLVLLVAIKTGDDSGHDALMKVAAYHPFMAEEVNELNYETRLRELTFVNPRFPTTTYTLQSGTRFCLSPLCWKFERNAGEFKCCQRCRFRVYCGQSCQRIAWSSMNHKKQCAREKQASEKIKRTRVQLREHKEKIRQQEQESQQQEEHP